VDSVRDNQHWIGAVYYNIIQKTFNNKNYYTLFGYDENDARSTKKWMEVLTFDQNNRPNSEAGILIIRLMIPNRRSLLTGFVLNSKKKPTQN
jgi:hypothetical protein